MKWWLLVLQASVMLFVTNCAMAGDINGKVVGVHDGDTLTVLVEKTPIKIRLAGIDAPELKQAFGNNAKRALSELVFGKTVKVSDGGTDRYGRTPGVYVGPKWVNLALVQKGMAWVYLAYSHDPDLLAAEASAKAGRTGLWRDPNPVPPWEWRKDKTAK